MMPIFLSLAFVFDFGGGGVGVAWGGGRIIKLTAFQLELFHGSNMGGVAWGVEWEGYACRAASEGSIKVTAFYLESLAQILSHVNFKYLPLIIFVEHLHVSKALIALEIRIS